MFKDIENGLVEWVFENARLKYEEYTNLIKDEIQAFSMNKQKHASSTDFLENLYLHLHYTTQEF